MRLGQLARKVNVKPVQIISFLEKEHGITVEDNLNSKIEDDSLALVLNQFKVEKKIIEPKTKEKKVVIKEEVEEAVVETEITEEVIDVIEEKAEEPVVLEENKPKIDEVEPTETVEEKLIAVDEDGEEIELRVVDGIIKAPKKELEGFKVIGKIDLPTKKKAITFIVSKGNESIDITEEVLEMRQELAKVKKEQYLERKKKRQNKSNERKSGRRKVLTELELKEKVNKLAVEKQIKSSKVNKELKKKHYKEKIQPNSTPHKMKKKKIVGNDGGIKTIKGYDKEPTTKLGKLWKWFNT